MKKVLCLIMVVCFALSVNASGVIGVAGTTGWIPYKIQDPYCWQVWRGDTAKMNIYSDSNVMSGTNPLSISYTDIYMKKLKRGFALKLDINGKLDTVATGTGSGTFWSRSSGTLYPSTLTDIVAIGTTAKMGLLTVAANNRVTFGADTSGAGTKFLWIPKKYALRIGAAVGTEWDYDSIGMRSLVIGNGSIASGSNTMCLGNSLCARYAGDRLIGLFDTAFNDYDYIIGNTNKAYGQYNHLYGSNLIGTCQYMTAMGLYNDTTGSGLPCRNCATSSTPLWVLGNGSIGARSNAITVLMNGNTGIGTHPSYPLDVKGDIHTDGKIYMEKDSVILTIDSLALLAIDFTKFNFYSNGRKYDSIKASAAQYNTAFGLGALDSLKANGANSAFGLSALQSLKSGWSNSVFGINSFKSFVGGNNNTALGADIATTLKTGEGNVFIGKGTAGTADNCNNNVAIGFEALTNVQSDNNIAISYHALLNTTTGNNNVAIGTNAGYGNISGHDNVIIGGNTNGGDTAKFCTIIGQAAGAKNSGSWNTTVGESSFRNNVNGFGNSIFGQDAGANIKTNWNTALGVMSGVNVADSSIDSCTLTLGVNTKSYSSFAIHLHTCNYDDPTAKTYNDNGIFHVSVFLDSLEQFYKFPFATVTSFTQTGHYHLLVDSAGYAIAEAAFTMDSATQSVNTNMLHSETARISYNNSYQDGKITIGQSGAFFAITNGLYGSVAKGGIKKRFIIYKEY